MLDRERVSLLGRTDNLTAVSADIVFDTRVDPVLPRNAMYARAGVSRLRPSLIRTDLESDGYIGLVGGNVLVLRALRTGFNHEAPPFFQPMLGGSDTLRGFAAGTAVGDTMVSTSVELRTPLTSPLSLARFGTSVFIDAGTAYPVGQRFSDQHLKQGVGGGVWLTAAAFRISLMVGHGIGAGNRVHFGAGLTF
jgi:outer membrane protein assembly factor BamA